MADCKIYKATISNCDTAAYGCSPIEALHYLLAEQTVAWPLETILITMEQQQCAK